MIRRIVLFKKKAEASKEEFQTAVEGLAPLDKRIPDIASWWVSVDVGRDGLWDAVLAADFKDASALAIYNDHPEHVAVATVIAGVSEFAVFDAEIND